MQYFFINQNGQQSGPVAPEAFKINGITGNTMVWSEGMDNWQEAQSIPELRKYFKSSFLNLPILIVYALVMTIVLSLLSIPVTAMIASAFDTYAYYIPIPVLVISVLTILFFIIKKYRHLLRNAFFYACQFSLHPFFQSFIFRTAACTKADIVLFIKTGMKGF